MKTDNVIIRPGAFIGYMGPQWLFAGVEFDLKPGVDAAHFMEALRQQVGYHHDCAINNKGYTFDPKTRSLEARIVPDMVVGFYANGMGDVYRQVQAIKRMDEVERLVGFASLDVYEGPIDLMNLDWRILKLLRADVSQNDIAEALAVSRDIVEGRLTFMTSLPLGVALGSPHPGAWVARVVEIEFVGATYEDLVRHVATILRAPSEEMGRKLTFKIVSSNLNLSSYVLVPFQNHDQFLEFLYQLANIEGVGVLGYLETVDSFMHQPWLDRFIDAQIEKTAQ